MLNYICVEVSLFAKVQHLAKIVNTQVAEPLSDKLAKSFVSTSKAASSNVGQTSRAETASLFAEAGKLNSRQYHSGDTTPELTKVLSNHPVAQKLLNVAAFQHDGLCHAAHRSVAIEAAGGDESFGYIVGKALHNLSGVPHTKDADNAVSSNTTSNPTEPLKLESEIQYRMIGPEISDIVEKVQERGLVILTGSGLAADDSKQGEVGNPALKEKANAMGEHANDAHSKIIFAVGTIKDVAADFGVTTDELSALSGYDAEQAVVAAFDMDHHRMTFKMDEIIKTTGLAREDLHTLSAQQLMDLGADQTMLSISPLADLESSYQSSLVNPIDGFLITGASMTWPNEQASEVLMSKAP